MSERICVHDGCNRPVATRDWCKTHYEKLRVAGKIVIKPKARLVAECRHPSCRIVSDHLVQGYCSGHYHRLQRYGSADGGKCQRNTGMTIAEILTAGSVPSSTGCVEYLRCNDRDGYGVMSHEGVTGRAHRFAWELANDRSIPDGLVVRHTCDNPPCVNPGHLLLGTNQDNVDDKVERERQAWGHGRGPRKLTWERAAAMRAVMADGMSDTAVARVFGVHRTVANKVRRGAIWNPALANPDRPT